MVFGVGVARGIKEASFVILKNEVSFREFMQSGFKNRFILPSV